MLSRCGLLSRLEHIADRFAQDFPDVGVSTWIQLIGWLLHDAYCLARHCILYFTVLHLRGLCTEADADLSTQILRVELQQDLDCFAETLLNLTASQGAMPALLQTLTWVVEYSCLWSRRLTSTTSMTRESRLCMPQHGISIVAL